jgi:hypothetical protein
MEINLRGGGSSEKLFETLNSLACLVCEMLYVL